MATAATKDISSLPGTKAAPQASSSGWMTTKRSKRNNPDATAATTLSSPDTAKTQQSPPDSTAAGLPLDWTRVKRRRSNDNGNENCCPPPSLRTPALLRQTYANNPKHRVVQGLAVVCLHDTNPSWFQGYFFPGVDTSSFSTDGEKPWGLLAVQEELDDCLKCADGGYRRITLSVFPFPQKRKHTMPQVDWTGGDMMRLAGDKVHLEPDRLSTDSRAIPLVHKYFQGLVDKCRAKLDSEERDDSGAVATNSCNNDPKTNISVLEMFPDIAVLSGPMTLVVPNLSLGEDEDGF